MTAAITHRRISARIAVLFFTFVCTGVTRENWTIGDINFTGDDALRRGRLLEIMELQLPQLWGASFYSFSTLVEDIAAIDRYYENRGYYQAQVTIDHITRDSSANQVFIRLAIEKGERTTVDSIGFADNQILSDAQLQKAIRFHAGAPLDSALVAQAAESIRNAYGRRGHLFAGVNTLIDIDRKSRTAAVTFSIDEGPLATAGGVQIYGLENLDPELVMRELQFKLGDTLTTKKLARSISRLYGAGLFDLVRIDPIAPPAYLANEPTVAAPVLVQIREVDIFAIQAGAGYSSFEQFYAHVEAAYRNFFDLGHRLSVFAKVSGAVQGGRATYTYPWFLSYPLTAEFRGYVERRDQQSFQGLFEGMEAAVRGRFGGAGAWSFWTQLERVETLDEPPPTEEFPAVPQKSMLLFGAHISRDTRINALYPGRSMFARLQTEVAGPGMAFSYQFFRIQGDLRGYWPLSDWILFSAAGFAGWINGYGDNDLVPPQERYRAGIGDVRPIRGYDEEAVSPVDERGVTRGGTATMILTPAELDITVYRWIHAIAFMDGGFVWRDLTSVALPNLRWSAGPGLRLHVFGGIFRIEYGFRLEELPEVNGQVHLGIGRPF